MSEDKELLAQKLFGRAVIDDKGRVIGHVKGEDPKPGARPIDKVKAALVNKGKRTQDRITIALNAAAVAASEAARVRSSETLTSLDSKLEAKSKLAEIKARVDEQFRAADRELQTLLDPDDQTRQFKTAVAERRAEIAAVLNGGK